MNIYHIQILNGEKSYTVDVKANTVGWSEAGLYEFIQNENGIRKVVAYYPVSKSVIFNITYNVEK